MVILRRASKKRQSQRILTRRSQRGKGSSLSLGIRFFGCHSWGPTRREVKINKQDRILVLRQLVSVAIRLENIRV